MLAFVFYVYVFSFFFFCFLFHLTWLMPLTTFMPCSGVVDAREEESKDGGGCKQLLQHHGQGSESLTPGPAASYSRWRGKIYKLHAFFFLNLCVRMEHIRTNTFCVRIASFNSYFYFSTLAHRPECMWWHTKCLWKNAEWQARARQED